LSPSIIEKSDKHGDCGKGFKKKAKFTLGYTFRGSLFHFILQREINLINYSFNHSLNNNNFFIILNFNGRKHSYFQ
jgi:uncharacterized protein YydD (DUF2326 family)